MFNGALELLHDRSKRNKETEKWGGKKGGEGAGGKRREDEGVWGGRVERTGGEDNRSVSVNVNMAHFTTIHERKGR